MTRTYMKAFQIDTPFSVPSNLLLKWPPENKGGISI